MLRVIKASQQRKISLATLLTGLVSLSVLLTLTILLIASYQSSKKSLIDTTLTLNLTNASKMSQTIDSLFKSMRSSLYKSATFYSNMSSMTEDEIYSNLELIRYSSNYFNSIALVDETGLVRSMSPKSIGSAGKYITTEESKTALALQQPYLSKPYIAATTGRLLVFMSEPIYDMNGTYRGYISGTIYLQEENILNMIFRSNPTDEIGSHFYIVENEGRLLFHQDTNRIGEDISANQVVRKLIQGQSGHEQTVSLKGEALLAGYVKVPANGWGVVVASPIDVVNDQLEQHIGAVLLYMMLPFLMLLLVVIGFARKLAKPFVTLADLVSKIGRDKVEIPEIKQHWNREADLLTKSIRYAISDIKKQTDQLTHEAMTDPLTGLTNRRTLEIIMHQWMEEQTPFSIIIMDIDRFKSINDTYGHQAGDEVLKHFAQIITSTVRPGDVCCRFGGEEFIALISHAAIDEAFLVAERIRHTLEKNIHPIGQPITVSQGIAHYPSHSASAEELIHMADQALYKAKQSGRNQTHIAKFR
ncbi:sensor domain-containing diguanylate cyclase [Paenibacillus radicis (ex Xue et al. 2023)]|uniref:Sensor domain-containing diguanylate cyclase n=1 Tax=Paenibacillus radicis (ex Xue et al. 2023) TaxID=2972489 RepID=A0ABT1YMA2_9BACL|nr:sensor domain-containing diguanylate cyclase [Paenibacillus radicis (ex Xue et al. 2023)]MCR8634301.1 sensor domain-containing diguanylate cyclase [Paenibacillus radicis (ex Xue et al. 2023)]